MKPASPAAIVPLMLAVSGVVHAQSACVYPQAPQTYPDGATASKEEMLATQTTIKTYQAAVDEFLYFFPSAAVHGRIVEYGRDIVAGGKAVIARLVELAARGAFVHTDDAGDCEHCDYRGACQAVNPDLKAHCGQSARKLANRDNRAIEPFVELRLGR